MLVLSICAGIAFHYSEFISSNPVIQGNLFTVAKSSYAEFMKDYNLIHPTWGFTPETYSNYIRESMIKKRKQKNEEIESEFSIVLQDNVELKEHLFHNYV